MAKDMRNGILLLPLLCYVSFVISQFHFGHTSSYSNNINVTCIESERKALLEFKASLVDRAHRLASWTTREDCCNWAGITCNPHTGHVQRLHLRNPIQFYSDVYYSNGDSYENNSLGGEINPSILNLEHLNYLDLSCNDFSGIQIPAFFGSFKNLRYLNLTGAKFGGEIPPHLGNLSHLQYLCLGSNVFISNGLSSTSLMWIPRLLSLKALDLSHTNLTDCVDWWYYVNMLPSLSSLSLRHCGIGSGTYLSPPLSSTVANLTSLVSLDLGDNDLRSNSTILFFSLFLNASSPLAILSLDSNHLQDPIPIILGKLLPTLTVLNVSDNHFNSPSMLNSLCNHTNLVSLDLSWNNIQGSLPLCLGNLTSLSVLHLSGNKFVGKIPSELSNLIQLTTLGLSYNQFRCSIPSSIGQLAKLQNLYLSNNQLYGVIPSTIGQLSKLQNLFISENLLNGELPSTIGQLSKLQYFFISKNLLTGELPSTIGQLAELQYFDISYNSFAGELSESHFEKVKRLKYLSISCSYFLSFIVSSQWVPVFQLREVHMDSVSLGPQFPPWLQTQRDVIRLSMKNASISGVIPSWFLTSCSSIKFLDLSNNNIHGSLISIPPNIEALFLSNNFFTLSDINYLTNMLLRVITLRLDNNLLAGSIPTDLCDLWSVSVLSLANNQLSGNIPQCFGNLWRLFVLDLSNNSISGHIPSTLGNLNSLLALHLSRNKLYGVIPSSLKNLKDLSTLDLGENQLTGTIPEWIGKELSRLQFLRLQSNNFYGKISPHLCQLSVLQILNLAHNNLVGHIPHCFDNLTMMRSKDAGAPSVHFCDFNVYIETLWNEMKGTQHEYTLNLRYAKFISLSTNNLTGEIPTELLDLEGVQNLNLSNNKLSGSIPKDIGKLKNLEPLDLAVNRLSGTIPQSLANIDTLSFLNLSFNNLVGPIPSGSQFDTFNDESIYEGNIGLCGKPLAKSCPDDMSAEGKGPAFQKDSDEVFEMSWFYSGMGIGFGVGFVGVFSFLCWKKSWRHAWFRFVEVICDKVWVTFAISVSQFQRKLIN